MSSRYKFPLPLVIVFTRSQNRAAFINNYPLYNCASPSLEGQLKRARRFGQNSAEVGLLFFFAPLSLHTHVINGWPVPLSAP